MAESLVKPVAFDDLEVLEDRDQVRYELWDGRIVAMTGGTLAHNLIALGLHGVIKSQLKTPCIATVADVGLRLSASADSNKAYPDVMVICDPDPGPYQSSPLLVAEVLSDSSVQRDRVRKRNAYTGIDSVQVYLILAQTTAAIEVYRRENDWRQETYSGLEAVIDLQTPQLRLPLVDIYRDVIDLLGLDDR